MILNLIFLKIKDNKKKHAKLPSMQGVHSLLIKSRLLMTFANSLDPDQARHFVQYENYLVTYSQRIKSPWWYSLKN